MIIITREQQLSTALISFHRTFSQSSCLRWILTCWIPRCLEATPHFWLFSTLFSVSLFWGCGGTRRGKDRQSRAAFCKISIQWYYEYWLILCIIFLYFPVTGRTVTTSLTVPLMIKKKFWLSKKKPFQNPNPKSTTHENLLLWLLRKHLFKARQTFPTKLLTERTFSWKGKKERKKNTTQCLELIKLHYAQERGITTRRRESDTTRITLAVCLVHKSLEQKLKPLHGS